MQMIEVQTKTRPRLRNLVRCRQLIEYYRQEQTPTPVGHTRKRSSEALRLMWPPRNLMQKGLDILSHVGHATINQNRNIIALAFIHNHSLSPTTSAAFLLRVMHTPGRFYDLLSPHTCHKFSFRKWSKSIRPLLHLLPSGSPRPSYLHQAPDSPREVAQNSLHRIDLTRPTVASAQHQTSHALTSLRRRTQCSSASGQFDSPLASLPQPSHSDPLLSPPQSVHLGMWIAFARRTTSST